MTWCSPVELASYSRRLEFCADRQGAVLALMAHLGGYVRPADLTEHFEGMTSDNACCVLRAMALNGKVKRHGRRGHYWYTAA